LNVVVEAVEKASPAEIPRVRDFVTLAKPEVTSLVIAATFIGFHLGAPKPLDLLLLFHVLLGTALVAGGTAALNMYVEREADGRMRRTAQRPIPAGRMRPGTALAFGLGMVLSGVVYLLLLVNPLSSLLAFLTMASYLLLYTPLKSRTWLCTTIGAFPGAMPPLIGWAGAAGSLSSESWALYAILFLWQFPHFLAIAWMYRQDYERGGMVMLPPSDREGRATFGQIVSFTSLLLPISLLPSSMGVAGSIYLYGAIVLGLLFLACAMWAAIGRTTARARWLLHASVAYLPLLYVLLVLDS
jgi:protoheme IX farnesyltransferase